MILSLQRQARACLAQLLTHPERRAVEEKGRPSGDERIEILHVQRCPFRQPDHGSVAGFSNVRCESRRKGRKHEPRPEFADTYERVFGAYTGLYPAVAPVMRPLTRVAAADRAAGVADDAAAAHRVIAR